MAIRTPASVIELLQKLSLGVPRFLGRAKVDAVVCGTDGVTYKNDCEMRVAACEKEQYIMVGSRGPCDLCQNVHCKHGARCEGGHCICAFDCPDAYDPVCGSDGTTYRNDCEMRRGSCQKGINLATVFFGECDRTPSGSWEDYLEKVKLGILDPKKLGILDPIKNYCSFDVVADRITFCGWDKFSAAWSLPAIWQLKYRE
ncbi:Agrin [Araneus ventricosus]|uniref:Agrin n=1 Tax=Araneus ventricosus TaxID=182803 RepID=A0A4Y2P7G7_ARAVE|nr:Agrin [Araneus ventricosus]